MDLQYYPNSYLVLYKNVELDNTYQHTFYFGESESEGIREALFGGGASSYPIVENFTDVMYQVVKGENKIRIPIDKMKYGSTSIFEVNYMRFKNTNYENKWFYAFVTEITYINDKVCELTYELDVMTTFYFDYRLGTSFVEREHSALDSWEDCLVPESLETGEYNFNTDQTLKPVHLQTVMPVGTTAPWSYDISLVLVANDSYLPASQQTSPIDFSMRNGLPSSMIFIKEPFAVWDSTNGKYDIVSSTALQTFYDTYIKPYVENGKSEALLGLFLMPSQLVPTAPIAMEDAYEYSIHCDLKEYFSDGKTSYAPYNKKLFTFPYKFCYVRDASGNACVYRYEFTTHFGSQSEVPPAQRNSIWFAYTGNVDANPSSILIPKWYKGMTGTDGSLSAYNFDEAMLFSAFPQLSLVTDAYKEWVAQNGTLTMLAGLKGCLGGISNASYGAVLAGSGNVAQLTQVGAGMASVGLNIMQTMAQFQKAGLMPNQTLSAGTTSALSLYNVMDFMMGVKEITPAMARCIDDYFTMYGYACHKCKIPSRSNRNYWTYTKTMGCVINGNVPNKYLKKIASIFDNGITFWHTSERNSVGDYSQGAGRINSPIG